MCGDTFLLLQQARVHEDLGDTEQVRFWFHCIFACARFRGYCARLAAACLFFCFCSSDFVFRLVKYTDACFSWTAATLKRLQVWVLSRLCMQQQLWWRLQCCREHRLRHFQSSPFQRLFRSSQCDSIFIHHASWNSVFSFTATSLNLPWDTIAACCKLGSRCFRIVLCVQLCSCSLISSAFTVYYSLPHSPWSCGITLAFAASTLASTSNFSFNF